MLIVEFGLPSFSVVFHNAAASFSRRSIIGLVKYAAVCNCSSEQFLPENFSTTPEKTGMLTCQITLLDSPHPVIFSKNPGFRARYLAQQNEFRFFRLINTKKCFFSLLAAGFCPKKLAFSPKNNGFARVWGAAALPAPWLVRVW